MCDNLQESLAVRPSILAEAETELNFCCTGNLLAQQDKQGAQSAGMVISVEARNPGLPAHEQPRTAMPGQEVSRPQSMQHGNSRADQNSLSEASELPMQHSDSPLYSDATPIGLEPSELPASAEQLVAQLPSNARTSVYQQAAASLNDSAVRPEEHPESWQRQDGREGTAADSPFDEFSLPQPARETMQEVVGAAKSPSADAGKHTFPGRGTPNDSFVAVFLALLHEQLLRPQRPSLLWVFLGRQSKADFRHHSLPPPALHTFKQHKACAFCEQHPSKRK